MSSKNIKVGDIWLDGTGARIDIIKIEPQAKYKIVGYCHDTKQKVSYFEDGVFSKDSSKYKEFDLIKKV